MPLPVQRYNLLAIVLLACLSAGAQAVDAVRDLKLVPFDVAEAANNVAKINAWLDSLRNPYNVGGKPVRGRLYKLLIPAGIYYFDDEIVIPPKTAPRIEGATGTTYALGEWSIDENSPGGPAVWLVRLPSPDHAGEETAVIRNQGYGSDIGHLAIYGRRLPKNHFSGEGPRADYGIVLEGRAGVGADPPTGWHHIHDVTFVDVRVPILADDSPAEEHADSSLFEHVGAYWFDTFFRSENQQAIGHTFQNITLCPDGKTHAIAFEMLRGGYINASSIHLNGPKFTLLKLRDYSPNTNRFDVNFRWDTPAEPPGELTLLDCSEADDYPFAVRLTGLIAAHEQRARSFYDPRELFRFAPEAQQQDQDVRCDVTNMPAAFTRKYR
jgi:hypothetical protein